jgi:hypothetical protein
MRSKRDFSNLPDCQPPMHVVVRNLVRAIHPGYRSGSVAQSYV